MPKSKKIMLVAWDKLIRDAFASQLIDIFGESIIIHKVALAEKEKISVSDYDLVVCSSKVIYETVRNVVPENIKVITVRRAINLENIFKVINLPKNENVLVVSNYRYTALETIKLLKELGIEHVNYIPYYPGAEYYKTEIAVTSGGKHLVPDGISEIIDLGIKSIDISTIIEILLFLELPLENTNLLAAMYTKRMINLNKYSGQLNMVLMGILSTSHDGIIAVDDKNTILFFNKMASELLGIPALNTINKNIRDILSDKKLLNIITDNHNRINEIVFYNDRYILTNKENLSQEGVFNGKIISFKDITEIQKIEYEVRKKLRKKGFIAKYSFNDIISTSEQMKKTVNIAKKIASNDLTVLIRGESGTGKELFAQAIHNASKRRKNPFVAVNLASLSESLIESELFGYEDGAFTGARKGGKIGLFEQAHTGTIFIDEIGDAPLSLQVRLLRVLQEKEIMRIGGNSIIPVDVRVIAATNKNLAQLVEEGKFRRDLYHRLKVLYFTIPPLRERTEDIYSLVEYFLKKNNSDKKITDEVYEVFSKYHWPGNIRELENLINYITCVVESDTVHLDDLPEDFNLPDYHESAIHHWEGIKKSLMKHAEIKEFIFILKELQQAGEKNMGLGRYRIKENLKKLNLNLTSSMIRNRLKILEEMGLVSIGTTRQGTRITNAGINFLKSSKLCTDEFCG
ncbi:MAG: hypothetical protein PWR10_545 [Halanaerobiales bacterium]|nr:hypothetical protein [Halanaerobiales bacterium]